MSILKDHSGSQEMNCVRDSERFASSMFLSFLNSQIPIIRSKVIVDGAYVQKERKN